MMSITDMALLKAKGKYAGKVWQVFSSFSDGTVDLVSGNDLVNVDAEVIQNAAVSD